MASKYNPEIAERVFRKELSVADAATEAGVDRVTIWRWRKRYQANLKEADLAKELIGQWGFRDDMKPHHATLVAEVHKDLKEIGEGTRAPTQDKQTFEIVDKRSRGDQENDPDRG